MGIFDKFFQKPPPVTLQDSVFGLIEFQSTYGFVMWCHTPADARDHLIIIDAPETGPTPLQRNFYSRLRGSLPARVAEARAFIAAQEAAPANAVALKLYSVEIGEDAEVAAGQFVLELSGETADEIHRVEFSSDKPDIYSLAE